MSTLESKSAQFKDYPDPQAPINRFEMADRYFEAAKSEFVDGYGNWYDERSLGQAAVIGNLSSLSGALFADAHESVASKKSYLARERTALQDLDEHQAWMINDVMNSSTPSPWLEERMADLFKFDKKKNLQAMSAGYDHVKMLTATDKDGKYIVDDELFMNYLQWHQRAVVEAQHEFNKDLDTTMNRFSGRIDTAIAKGWAPAWLSERVSGRIGQTKFVIDDGMRTKVTRGNVAGYAGRLPSLENYIVLEPEVFEDKRQSRDNIVTHELTHALDGHVIDQDDNTHRRGLYRLFDDVDEYGPTALNEAVVEHFADSIYKGKGLDTIDPSHHHRQHAVYYDERLLLDTLCHGGTKPIDIRLFVAAHFQHDPTDLYDGDVPLDRLKAELDEAFPGMNIRQRIQTIEEDTDVRSFTDGLRAELGMSDHSKAEKRVRRRSRMKRAIATTAMGSLVGTAIGLGAARLDLVQIEKDHPAVSVNHGNDTLPNQPVQNSYGTSGVASYSINMDDGNYTVQLPPSK